MANQTIKLKNTNVAGNVPAADKLATAELVINLKDKKLFSKDADGAVFELSSGSTDAPVTSVNGETGVVVLDAGDVGAVKIGDVNPVYFANQGAFPDASSADVHGGVAHSHADGAMFFAHGGSWEKLANSADLSDYVPLGSWDSIPALT